MIAPLLLVAALGQVPAQNVRPEIAYVFPPGAAAGSTVEVRLGGYDWTPDTEVIVHDPRIKIEITGPLSDFIITPPPYWFGIKAGQAQPPLAREVPARIKIPADFPQGPVRWQVANANGGSDVATFVVGEDREVIEPAASAEGPLDLGVLPVTVSGRLSKISEVDAFRFTAPASGLVVCRLDDQLGQPFFGVLTIRDAQGRLVQDQADTTGKGATVMFQAQAGAAYTASVNDAEFAGDTGFVYRLSISRRPVFMTSLPLVVGRGQKQSVEFFGWGLADGKAQIQSLRRDVDVPPDAAESFLYVLSAPGGIVHVPLSVADAADSPEPAETPDAPRVIAAPLAASCTFDRVDPVMGVPIDRFQFAAKKGNVFRIRAEAASFGSTVDPSLVVVAADGKEVARSDDLSGSVDAGVVTKPLPEGIYELIVCDVSGNPPTAASVYRLTFDAEADLTDFTLLIPVKLDVPLGGTVDLPLKAERRGTWKSPIALRWEGLPDGVSVPADAAIPEGKPDLKLTFTASEEAAARSSLATLVATAVIGERTVEHRFGPILVTSTLKTRCVVKSAVQDGGRLVNRGTTYPADVIVERLEGYEGPVKLLMASKQSRQRRGIRSDEVVVPAGVGRTEYPIFMPEWLETSLTCRMNLIGVVEVPDPKGNVRHVTGIMDGQVVMSMEGGLLKISHEPQEFVTHPGGTLEIPIRLSRTVRLLQPAQIDVLVSDEFDGLVTSDSQVLPADQTSAVVRLSVDGKAKPTGAVNVTIRATALQDGRWPAVSETVVPVVIEQMNEAP